MTWIVWWWRYLKVVWYKHSSDHPIINRGAINVASFETKRAFLANQGKGPEIFFDNAKITGETTI